MVQTNSVLLVAVSPGFRCVRSLQVFSRGFPARLLSVIFGAIYGCQEN